MKAENAHVLRQGHLYELDNHIIMFRVCLTDDSAKNDFNELFKNVNLLLDVLHKLQVQIHTPCLDVPVITNTHGPSGIM